ncbi:polyisoprenoid-binding protein YceI [Streptomyces sp. Amel2xB2]|uniref:YceI family protein n=1 Tax=Streptomyces sp. Amel2xB2 TaxID=1305829 RepID=UPI000DBA06E8|nr:YceI family protein [Streptomyces sp. Amel2xB2]RAJ70000.1 polyisoprenoid-binding protein YceI [Streptomyces sp. Amel2xB2]
METRQDHDPAAARTPGPGRYEIDTAASALGFTTRHFFGLLPVRGTFAVGAGSVDVVEPLAASSAHAEIDAGSFSTGNRARDKTVRSPAFLDTARHPVMTYDADGVEEAADGTWRITGTLTVAGAARPLALEVLERNVGQGEFTVWAAADVDRREFGVTASPGMTGRRLRVELRVRCVRV